MDTSSDKDERMYHALRAAYEKYGKLTYRQAKKLCNLHREGTGGISVYQRVHTNLLRTHEIEQAGLNRKRQPIFKWVGTESPFGWDERDPCDSVYRHPIFFQ
jgi:hypothetical protein